MDKRLQELDNLAKGIESNVYTSCLINIFPQDFDNVYWAIRTIKNQQELIESQARLLEGFTSDMEDIKSRLDGVREDIKTARDTVILEDHNECIYNAIDSLNYIIDFALSEIEQGLKR